MTTPDQIASATAKLDRSPAMLALTRDRLLLDGLKEANTTPLSTSDSWPEPLPLVGENQREPYPVDALPEGIRAAVQEVTSFVQCPVALTACSALSALSLSAQHVVDVARGSALQGPTSLYLLAVAESGDRKSEVDKRFATAITLWQANQRLSLRDEVAEYRAQRQSWEARRDGIKARLRKPKPPSNVEELNHELVQLERNPPKPVREPRLRLENETTEALLWSLADPAGWPSAGLMSAEAGVVFGGHSMGSDKQMQTFAVFNKLWSGESQSVGRRTSESFDVRGARFSMGLAVQPATLQSFVEATGKLARGTGYLARFLIAWPDSTQGHRPYRDAPSSWPCLEFFTQRLHALLNIPLSFDEHGSLTPNLLTMSDTGFECWRSVHDGIERELGEDGELETLRDSGSKAAENVARLAALFHVFEHGLTGQISARHVEDAGQIVAWHLTEARRCLGELGEPLPVRHADRLDRWLVQRCRDTGVCEVLRAHILQLGPNPTRKAERLNEALRELVGAGRVRCIENRIAVNPSLLARG